jgi:hypothetical protein
MPIVDERAWAWFQGSDTGTSSMTIWSVMTGLAVRHTDVPHDPDDFGRCYRLLQRFPEWSTRLDEVAAKFPAWGPLVRAWPELTRRYERALARNLKRAPKMYRRIRELVDEGYAAARAEKERAAS